MGSSRAAIPHSQRIALRRYYQTTEPKPSHAALKIWFRTHFGHEISQSIISRSLSDSFAYLDVFIPTRQVVEPIPKFRIRSCQWPWLDSLLSEWLQVVEARSGKVPDEVIKSKARQIWKDSDKSQDLAMPKFSSGWVTKFRKRNQMRHQPHPDRRHTTATAAPLLTSSSSSHTTPVETLEQAFLVSTTPPKATTRHVPTNNTSPNSRFSTSTSPTLSSDHLIHLIQHNVFRALISNKSLLRTTSNLVHVPYQATLANESAARLCGGLTVIRPLSDHNMPISLYPTLLQMNCVHTSWIDMFPFPKFRDNLIKKGVGFVPEEMIQDLFGDIFPDFVAQVPCRNGTTLLSIPTMTPRMGGASNDREVEDSDDVTAGRRCLITWGDPWKIESWEVTPGFLERWGWTLEGCDDLIQASNRWRTLRDEEVMKFR